MGKKWPYRKTKAKNIGSKTKTYSKKNSKTGVSLRQLSDLSSHARVSLGVLLLANLVPVIGVMYFDWDHRLVIGLFWIENLIIGGFNLAKMIGAMLVNKRIDPVTPIFFTAHYGFFCIVHGLILWELLGFEEIEVVRETGAGVLPQLTKLVAEGAAVFNGLIERYTPVIWLGIISLSLSKLVSFIEHFLLKGEIFSTTPNKLMGKPYGKIAIMHIGIILGAFAIEKFGSSVWLLLIIIGFKILVDVMTHIKDHQPRRDIIEEA